ncbi:MAG: hypothetical protein D6732_23165 [Methanobacteriota archaeon]|nr:MAG: hypothetical protein D6732_23165 [Euryarchaeota archaeon]
MSDHPFVGEGMSKIEEAWKTLMNTMGQDIHEQIRTTGYFDITAETFKEITAYEPRLGFKFDHKKNIPSPLKEERLSALPIANGTYRVAKTDPFISLDLNNVPHVNLGEFRIPNGIELLVPGALTSESKSLDAAFASGMIDALLSKAGKDKFVQYNSASGLYLTLRGREKSSSFNFSLKDDEDRNIRYAVAGVQIEVDSGYEWKNGVAIFEAKNSSDIKDITLRQVAFPVYSLRRKTAKQIMSWFMTHDFGTCQYNFWLLNAQSQFTPIAHYSAKILFPNKNNYLAQLNRIKVDEFEWGFKKPFPQADSLSMILLIVKLIGERCLTMEEIFSDTPLVPRQWYYYISAASWLGLVEKKGDCFSTTKKVQEAEDEFELLFKVGQTMLSNPVFNDVWNEKEIKKESIRKSELDQSKETYKRRLQTVKAWIKYIRTALAETEKD